MRIDMQSIVQMATGIAQGMNYLHSVKQRVIHRDLKSQNILIDSHFTPKVGLSVVRTPSMLTSFRSPTSASRTSALHPPRPRPGASALKQRSPGRTRRPWWWQ